MTLKELDGISMSAFKILAANSSIRIALPIFATISGAFFIEWLGYPPCELCLYQRIPYYLGVPLASALLFVSASKKHLKFELPVLVALAAVFLASMALGGFHAGVEWGLWQGPQACSGSIDTSSLANLVATLKAKKAVSCTTPAITIFGLSLSAWNFVISLGVFSLVDRRIREIKSR
jgi:disulfide bond formation protein DsbB